jgi:chitinase
MAPYMLNDRVKYYKQFCQELNVDPGNNLTC